MLKAGAAGRGLSAAHGPDVENRGLASDADGQPPSSGAPRGREDPADPIERFAQNSVSALERVGAELEAMFAGAPAAPRRREPAPTQAPVADSPPSTLDPRPSTLAVLDTELARQLMEEGIVVRGHDVARVVGLMAGARIAWGD